MVSTRQMTSGSGEGSSQEPSASTSGETSGPAKGTRTSTISSCGPPNPVAGPSRVGMASSSQQQRHILGLMDMPQEIIEKIFGYLSFKNICQLRFVCSRIDRICGSVLNSTFQRLQHQLFERFQGIKQKMPRRESARRNHPLACESDIVETLHMRLTLLQMSFGKHIERKHCCFFPGEILDEVLHILHYIQVTPKLARPYKVTDELFDLSTMAMEYFKDKIEPHLPEIAYFATDFLELSGSYHNTSSKNSMVCVETFPMDMEEVKGNESPPHHSSSLSDITIDEGVPQTHMVLRKGIRKIKQGMKRYSNQLSVLRHDLKSCKQKAAEQLKVVTDQQKQLAEQQKQIHEYATRLDENDKKNEEISRKFSTLLQELNKCKTELQYWRSKSPATPLFCTSCGSAVMPNAEELDALMNQGVNPEGLGLDLEPEQDFVPIEEELNDLLPEQEDFVENNIVNINVPSTSSAPSTSSVRAPPKRKVVVDNSQGPSTSKKSRRVAKGRSKRTKV